MALITQDFTTIVRNSVAAVQGAAATLLDVTVGSVQRALLEANAAVVMWLQALILQAAALTRAATSNGTDLDSWFLDYGFYRLPAATATGVVTFSRFTTTSQAVVPVGAKVQTADGSQIYTVALDTTNGAYSSSQGGYVIGVGVTSVSVTVTASAAGAAANAVAGAISVMGQSIAGVDTVTNAAGFTNGADAETDAAARIRFVAYIASPSRATNAAIGFAVANLNASVTYTITENFNYAGAAQNNYFYVVVDDGTGAPSGTFLSSASNAIDLVRPVTSSFGVFAPVLVTSNVSMTITNSAGYTHSEIVALVAAAITAYINSTSIGGLVAWTKLSQIAYEASPAVTNVSSVLLAGGTADVQATNKQIIRAGTVTVI